MLTVSCFEKTAALQQFLRSNETSQTEPEELKLFDLEAGSPSGISRKGFLLYGETTSNSGMESRRMAGSLPANKKR